MRKLFLLLALLALLALPAAAANWYVRPSSAGSNNGTDWNNAWNIASLNSGMGSLAAGDTVWLAGGTYTTELAITASGSSGSRLYFKRVTAADSVPVAAAGYSSGFNSQASFEVVSSGVYNQAQVTISGNYVTFDGGEASGIKFTMGLATALFNAVKTSGTFIQVRQTETAGRAAGLPAGKTIRFLAMYGSDNTSTSNYIHNVTQPYSLNGSDNMTLEYDRVFDNGWHSDVFDEANCACHDDIMEYTGSTGLVIRFCHWKNWHATGIMAWGGFGQAGSIHIYGCVFEGSMGTSGIIWPSNDPGQTSMGPVYFYNNLVIDGRACNDISDNVPFATGSLAKNNIYWGDDQYLGAWAWSSGMTRSYEFSFNATMAGSGTGTINNGTDPFEDFAGGNYQIVSNISATLPRNKGADLGSSFNVDRYSVIRGADGGWDIGAFEYGDAPPDTIDPVATITGPTSAATLATASAALSLSGTASDDVLLSTVTAAMSGATSGSITISGTTSWSGSATLNSGETVVTVTATDSTGNTGTDTITITYTPLAGGTITTLNIGTLNL